MKKVSFAKLTRHHYVTLRISVENVIFLVCLCFPQNQRFNGIKPDNPVNLSYPVQLIMISPLGP